MTQRIPLHGSHILSRHQHVGPASKQDLMSVTVLLRRPESIRAHLAQGPSLHLDRAQFLTRYGMQAADLAALRTFAAAHGLTVGAINHPARSVRLSAHVAQIEEAFGVSIQVYKDDLGKTYRANDGEASVPGELGAIVEHVLGLSERPVATPHIRHAPEGTHAARSYSPVELATLYQFPAGNGAGQCIALIELGGGYQTSDLQSFFSGLGLTTPTVTAFGVDGATNVPGGDPGGADGEVELDIEVAGGIAPGASIAVFFAPNTDAGFLDAINMAIHDSGHNASVISISWGGPETSWTPSSLTAFDDAFQSAAALGVTVCVAAGDNGSTDGTSANTADFPASSPHVLACGGTSLHASGTAIVSETVWNDGLGGGATGGGISASFAVPSYQSGFTATLTAGGSIALTGRGVPDIAGNADPVTGYAIVVDGHATVIGGTSAVAPLWAGLMARINALTGKRQGLIHSFLSNQVTRDITIGNNGSYRAAAGWDACTGWGSPQGAALLSALTMTATTRPAA